MLLSLPAMPTVPVFVAPHSIVLNKTPAELTGGAVEFHAVNTTAPSA
jgi:hypothetical protein